MKNSIKKRLAPYFKTFSSADQLKIDYFIQCVNEESCQKLTLSLLKKIGNWNHYGKTCFRGWSASSKEEITDYICKHSDLKKEEFKVLETHQSFFMIK